MYNQHCYSLQKYGGSRTRHTCPNCGRPRCFTLYVDNNEVPLNDVVGKCDHSSSCGYHYPPKEYFSDHPELCRERQLTYHNRRTKLHTPQPMRAPQVNILPFSLVERSVNLNIDSSLTTFLRLHIPDAIVDSLIFQYHIGVTKAGDTIFFQIDKNYQLRTGKIMKYNAETGRRIKDVAIGSRITWIHSLLKQQGAIPQDWQCTQCLFGEHLLAKDTDKPVGLVESEKTAIICAALMPQYTWIATGGKSQMNSRLTVLKDRIVIAFPDTDGYNDWKLAAQKFPELDLFISDHLEATSSESEKKAQIDIADRLIEYLQTHPFHEAQFNNPILRQIAKYLSPQHIPEVSALIEDFDLELSGIHYLEGVEASNHRD